MRGIGNCQPTKQRYNGFVAHNSNYTKNIRMDCFILFLLQLIITKNFIFDDQKLKFRNTDFAFFCLPA